ncbi:MAG: heme-binding protein [Crocinitomicaceae bacterium]|nr:heme-binding protein [Crocinitomicaceae bacterium]
MKIIILTIVILAIAFFISQLYISNNTSETNSIEYKTIAFKDGFQIREYSQQIVASTQLNGTSYSKVSSQGFKKIASYIFGGNSNNEQIAMTSPVQMDMGEKPTMSFFMPNNLSSQDLPRPNFKDVYLHVQPSKIVAAIEFSGWASDEILISKFNELKQKLDKESITYENSYSYLGYNPPYQIINRKNEIIIPLVNYK